MAVLKPLGYEIINLGSDQPVGLKDVIRLIERLVWNYLLAKVENFREPSSRSSAVTNVSS